MSQDLRSYLKKVSSKFPKEIIEVNEAIDPPNHEAAAYIKLIEDEGKFPVVLFKNVKNIKGEKSQFPLIHNIFATRPFCAMTIGLDPSNFRTGLTTSFGEMQEKPRDYEIIKTKDAPVMKNVWKGKDADITRLPGARYHEKDAGSLV